jgi:hypothetical protein
MLAAVLRVLFALCMAGAAFNVSAFLCVYAGVWPPLWAFALPAAAVFLVALRVCAARGWFE